MGGHACRLHRGLCQEKIRKGAGCCGKREIDFSHPSPILVFHICGAVAQLGERLNSISGGRRFDPDQLHQIFQRLGSSDSSLSCFSAADCPLDCAIQAGSWGRGPVSYKSAPVRVRGGWVCAGGKDGAAARCAREPGGYPLGGLRSMAGRNVRKENPTARHGGFWIPGHSWDQDVLQSCFPVVRPCRPH